MKSHLLLLLLYTGLCKFGVRSQKKSAVVNGKTTGRILFPGDLRNPRTVAQCDATVRKLEGWIYTPNYPSDYDDFRTCTYVIERYSSDICEVQMILVDFDLGKLRVAVGIILT
ncbi:uncharacterized protein LOC143228882 [Tachypleus tridentatus]|uniref:uncharacterized protein LOC143228882 n=1 Tax=Tachypleus tridentatus TaxID=6853 RepID=UPI003FCFC052